MTGFTLLRSPRVSGVEMKIYERSLQALLASAPRSRVLARLASLAQIGELARRLSAHLYTSHLSGGLPLGITVKTSRPFSSSSFSLQNIGNLSKDVFERRTSTGSETFSLFICLDSNKSVLLSFFSLIKMIYPRV